jgi:para-nitrobenzyl esterase
MPYEEARLNPAQRRLADRMVGYWSRFAKTGDPNGPGLPKWRPAPSVQGLDLGRIGPFDRDAAHKLEFWRSQLPA